MKRIFYLVELKFVKKKEKTSLNSWGQSGTIKTKKKKKSLKFVKFIERPFSITKRLKKKKKPP